MCGRYQLVDPREKYEVEFDIRGPAPNWNWPQRYNFSPTQTGPFVAIDGDDRHLKIGHWGLIPVWSKSGKMERSTFNARAETVQTSKLFAPAFKSRRAIIPATAFYEWTGPKSDRIPHEISRVDGAPLAMAGLWEQWQSKDKAETIISFTIIVCAANEFMSALHDRMPVILPKPDYKQWLTGSPDEAAELMRSAPEGILKERVVSKQLNSSKNEGPELLVAEVVA